MNRRIFLLIFVFTFFVGVLYFGGNVAFALTSGPNSGSSFTSDASNSGAVAWSIPTRASASDNSRTSAVMDVDQWSEYLNSQGFGFSIPAGATVQGILVEVEKLRTGSGNAVNDYEVFLLKAGTVVGTNHATASQWPTTDTYVSHGGSADLWGTTWTADDINNAGFGFVISALGTGSINSAQIDHVRITVTYAVASTVTVSGTIYSDEGSTAYNCSTNNLVVSIKVNGAGTASSTCTTSAGTYSVSGVSSAGSEVITAFVDNNGSVLANSITLASSTAANITGLDLYQNRVVVKQESATAITNTNLDQFDNGNDTDMLYTVTTGAYTGESGTKIVVPSGKTYTPGGSISTPAIGVAGTLSMGSNTLTLTAGGTNATCTGAAGTVMPLCVSGTFTAGTGITSFQSSAAATIAALTYYDLQINASGIAFSLAGSTASTLFTLTAGTLSVGSTLTVNGAGVDLTISSGATLSSTATISVPNGGFSIAGTLSGTGNISARYIVGNGTVNMTNGTTTLTYAGPTNFGGSGTYTFYNLTFSGTATNATTTSIASATTTVTGVLTISASHELNAGSNVWKLNSSSSAPLVVNGILTTASSTFNFDGVSSTIPANTYWNLGIGRTPDSLGSATYTLGGNTTVSNVVTLGVSSGSLSVDYLSPGSYTLTLAAAGTPVVANAYGSFSTTAGTVKYIGNGTIGMAATSYYNLTVDPTASSTYRFGTASSQSINIYGAVVLGLSSAGYTAVYNASTYDPTITFSGNVTLASCLKQDACASNITYQKGTTTLQFGGGAITLTDSDSTKQDLGVVNVNSGTVNLGSSVKLESVSIGNGATLNLNGSNTLTLTGTGTPFSMTAGATFTPSTGTVSYEGTTTATTVKGTTYYNLSIGASSGSTTYTLGGDTTVTSVLTIAASSGTNTLNASSYTVTLSGSGTPFVINSGETFTPSTSNFVYTGSAATTITATTYSNLTVSSTGVVFTFGGATTMNGDLAVNAGTASSSNTITVLGGDVTGNGTINATSTFTASSTGNFGGSSAWTFYNLTFSGANSTTTAVGSGGITVNNDLIINGLHGLNAGGKTWTLAGSDANPFTMNGTLVPATSTFVYTNNAVGFPTLEANGYDVSFYNLTLNSSGETFITGGNTQINGNLVVATGTTYRAPLSTQYLHVSGSFTNNGYFNNNSGTVTFDGTSTGKTIYIGTSTFYNVTFNGAGGAWSPTASTTITNDLIMSAGTLSGTQNIQVQGGDAYGSDGIINLTGGTFTLSGTGTFGASANWAFGSLTFSGAGTTTATSSAAGEIDTTQGILTVGSSHTLNAGSKLWKVSSTPSLSGTLNTASSTIDYDGVGSTLANLTYYNLMTSSTALETFSTPAALVVSNNLSIKGGLLYSAYNLTVQGGNASGTGWLSMDTGTTFTLLGTGLFGGSSSAAWSFVNLTFGDGVTAQTTSATSTAAVTVSGTFIVATSTTLQAGSKTWTLSGSGTPFARYGTFTPQTSTISYTGSSATNIASSTYYNLSIGGGATTSTYSLLNDTNVQGNLWVATSTGTNTFSLGNKTLTLSGSGHPLNIATSEVFSYGTSQVKYTGSTNVSLGTTYWDLLVGTDPDGVTTTYSLGANTTVLNNLYIGSDASTAIDTLDAGSYTLTLAGTTAPMNVYSKGAFSGGTGTVKYTGNGTTNITAKSSVTYNNLQLIPGASQGFVLGTDTGQTLTVNGNLDLALDNGSVTIDASNNNPNIVIGGNLTVGACVSGAGCASQMTFTKGSGTLTLSPTGTKTVTDNNSTKQNLGTISISGGASTPTITAGSNITADSISIAASHTFSPGGNTITLAGTGSPLSVSGTFNDGTSTMVFTGGGAATIPATTYYDLKIQPGSNTVTHTLGAGTVIVERDLTLGNGTNTGVVVTGNTNNTTLAVTRHITIATSTTFQANASNETAIGGNWTSNGTFTSNNGTINLNGSSLQTLTGTMTGGSAFGILRVTNNSGTDAQTDPSISFASSASATTSTLVTASTKAKFVAGGTFTSTNINWNGQATTTRVSLRSSSAGSQWNLVVSGGQTVRNVDAKDSSACGGTNIDATNVSNQNSGNNNCWNFAQATYTTSGTIFSHIIDTQIQGGAAPNSIKWIGTQPASTSVKFQIASSNSSSTDPSNWTFTAWNGVGACDTSSYYTPSAPNQWVEIKAQCHQNQRYFRWKAVLETTNTATSAIVTDVILNYAR